MLIVHHLHWGDEQILLKLAKIFLVFLSLSLLFGFFFKKVFAFFFRSTGLDVSGRIYTINFRYRSLEIVPLCSEPNEQVFPCATLKKSDVVNPKYLNTHNRAEFDLHRGRSTF